MAEHDGQPASERGDGDEVEWALLRQPLIHMLRLDLFSEGKVESCKAVGKSVALV